MNLASGPFDTSLDTGQPPGVSSALRHSSAVDPRGPPWVYHVRRRGRGWNVSIRVNGARHQYGPRTESLLRTAIPREIVEQWARAKYHELGGQAERAALREALDRLESHHHG